VTVFSRRRFRLVAWSIGNIHNWFSAIAGRLWQRPLEEIRFRNGLRFKIDLHAGDLLSVYEVFGDRFYDRYFRGILSNGTILDIGGNIGMFTVRAARDLVPQGRVIAVEPNPGCLARLKEHLRMNHLDNVETLEAAVTNAGDRVALHVAPIRGDSTLFAGNGGDGRQTIDVSAIGTRDVLRLADGFELVKVDCEGGEFALFYETEPEDWKNIKRIAIEYHLGFDRKYAVTPKQLATRVEELGLTVLILRQMSDQFGYLIAARA
jgi:FkbM family methyltransferase